MMTANIIEKNCTMQSHNRKLAIAKAIVLRTLTQFLKRQLLDMKVKFSTNFIFVK